MFLLFAGVCFAQDAQKWIEPNDSRLSGTEVRAMLEKVCPGHANASACEVCPEGADFTEGKWEVMAIFVGHFRSPASEDALISASGCESHASGFGGSALLTRDHASWAFVRYVSSMIAWDCRKLAGSDGRDRLVCGNADAHQGHASSWLYLLDPGLVSEKGDPTDPHYYDDHGVGFFSAEDTMDAAENLRISGIIDQVTFTNLAIPSNMHIDVYARMGKATIPDSVIAQEDPAVGLAVKVATVPRRFGFTFDGTKVIPDRNNPSTTAPVTSYSLAK
ncbi:MAG TPA: hypothetical protein VG273_16655 [Bryobacteraceae bacterium]|jgi:hypothetical protein|nr:hypothetical protein [Bryobacteraceae bacterium]